MKGKIRGALILILYLAGVGVFAIPDLYHLANNLANRQVYREFEENARKASEEKGGTGAPDENPSDAGTDEEIFTQLYEQMTAYNENIFANHQADLSDPWSYEQSSFDLTEYGIEDNVAAVIEIPRMDVELPVYLGATRKNMERGAVQLGQTSLPVGGVNTNCVIAAHRGYRGIPMFRDIEALRPGDEVIVHNFWETLTYEVSEIQVIYPSDIDKVLIRPGEDMVTLLTCHPYTQHTRRYAVFCTRTTGEETAGTEAQDGGKAELSAETAEKTASEDGDILRREKLLRTAGYGFLAAIGAAIAGKAIWNRAGRRRRFRK